MWTNMASLGALISPLNQAPPNLGGVLNGVGLDGVGVIFSPFFTHFSPFLRIFPLFSLLFSSSPEGQGQTTAIYWKNGEFHSDPVCTDPAQNFPINAPFLNVLCSSRFLRGKTAS